MQRAKHLFSRPGKPVLSGLLVALVLLLNAMAACEPLHKLIHHDADEAGHECVVTLFAHGQIDSTSCDVPVVLPAAWIETTSFVVVSVSGTAVENLPPGRAPPVFSVVS